MEVRYGHTRHNNRNACPESAACSTQRCRYAEAFRDDRSRCLAANTRPVPLPRLADHPKILCGEDNAPAPIEWVLHALARCLTAGIANISAARGVTLHSVECRVEGDIDLQGILGLSNKVRNGFQAIRVNYVVKGDAPEEKLRQIVDQARGRSAVFDILTGHVPVTIEVDL
jgi:uncharacterized OsmC-like protein